MRSLFASKSSKTSNVSFSFLVKACGSFILDDDINQGYTVITGPAKLEIETLLDPH